MRRRWALVGVLLGWGCGFDSGGVGSESGSIGDDGGGTEASASGMSATAEATSGGSAEASVTSDGESASGPDPSTTDGPPVTTTADTGADGPDTVTTTMAGDSTSTTDGGGATTTTPTTTGGGAAGYPPCPSGQDRECPAGFNCIPIFDGQNNVLSSYCGDMDCGVDGDCAAPSDGNATPECLQFSTPVCTLTCNFGETCPTGMICQGSEAGDLCAWP